MASSQQREALPSMTKGAYNANAKVQAHAIQFALDMLTEAANAIPITPGRPVQVLELGCSQGVNSMQPVKTILQALAARIPSLNPEGSQEQSQGQSPGQPQGPSAEQRQLQVVVAHEDLPSNDFESLFGLIGDADKTYLTQDSQSPLAVFPLAIGRSCYERLLPDASVHLVFSYNTLHWMSKKPVPCTDSLFVFTSNDQAVVKAWAQQSLSDLVNVLRLRAAEVVPGGMLQALFPVIDPASDKCWTTKTIQKVIPQWMAEGNVTPEEVSRLTMPVYFRKMPQVLLALDEAAPLWEVCSCTSRETMGPSYTRFAAGEMTAAEYAATMRNQVAAVMQGYMTSQLALTRGAEVAGRMVTELLQRFQDALAEEPEEEYMCMVYLSLRRTGTAVEAVVDTPVEGAEA